jgi:hypothetical protein
MKYSERDPHLAAMWLPYEESRELAKQGRIPEAVVKCEQALRAGEELLGPDSIHLFVILTLLGDIYYHADRPADSLALCLRLMAITPAMFGARDPTHGRTQWLTARAYRALGRPADALPLDEQNLAIQVITHGRAHPETVRAVVAMIDDYHGLGDQIKLKLYLEVAEQLISTVAGVDNNSVKKIRWHRAQLTPFLRRRRRPRSG